MDRVCIVGNSGAGKTTLARRVAVVLGVPHVELDALNHGPGWTEAPVAEFRAAVADALAEHERTRGGWVVDGNYRSRIADVVHPDVFVWLDYPRGVVVRRVVRRTLGRLLLRRELWNGNRERWRNIVTRDPRQNIVLWSWTQHDDCRRLFDEACAQEPARWVRLRDPRETETWLRTVRR